MPNQPDPIRTVDSQASDLRDAKSDAVDNMNKTGRHYWIVTTVRINTDGTVVEVNERCFKIDYRDQPNSGSHWEQREFTSQRGLSEYNLCPISLKVREVVPHFQGSSDKTWTGKILCSQLSDRRGSSGCQCSRWNTRKRWSRVPIYSGYYQ